ncbi:MAG: hypothetical protein Ct9H90mP13_09810 [Pseudomonadota bacterium]|nr:MAG: hypothetical protein Ct9H90mP13_09810 [Pseudomonadota bacterium]
MIQMVDADKPEVHTFRVFNFRPKKTVQYGLALRNNDLRKVKNGSQRGLSDQLILIQQELDMVLNNYYVSVD